MPWSARRSGTLVGAICCRLDRPAGADDSVRPPLRQPAREPRQGRLEKSFEKTEQKEQLNILTLAVLATYRSRGVGALLLEEVLRQAKGWGGRLDSASAHVHTGNERALRFYKRHGFRVHQTRRRYYRRLVPPDAFVLTRRLAVGNSS